MSDLYYCPVCLSTISEIKTAKANKDNRHMDVLVMKCGYTYRAVLYSDIGEPVYYEEESPCGQAEEYADDQRRTIDKITKQRDKLLKALRMMVNGKTTYVDDERNTSCVYCEQWVNFRHEYDPTILHTDDCPWLLAKAAIAEVEAQMKGEG